MYLSDYFKIRINKIQNSKDNKIVPLFTNYNYNNIYEYVFIKDNYGIKIWMKQTIKWLNSFI